MHDINHDIKSQNYGVKLNNLFMTDFPGRTEM